MRWKAKEYFKCPHPQNKADFYKSSVYASVKKTYKKKPLSCFLIQTVFGIAVNNS